MDEAELSAIEKRMRRADKDPMTDATALVMFDDAPALVAEVRRLRHESEEARREPGRRLQDDETELGARTWESRAAVVHGAMEEGRRKERAAIVAFLRRQHPEEHARAIAIDVEQGEHTREAP